MFRSLWSIPSSHAFGLFTQHLLFGHDGKVGAVITVPSPRISRPPFEINLLTWLSSVLCNLLCVSSFLPKIFLDMVFSLTPRGFRNPTFLSWMCKLWQKSTSTAKRVSFSQKKRKGRGLFLRWETFTFCNNWTCYRSWFPSEKLW